MRIAKYIGEIKENLIDYIDGITLGEGSYAFLMDSQNNIITHADNQYNPTADNITNIEEISNGKLSKILSLGDSTIDDKILKD